MSDSKPTWTVNSHKVLEQASSLDRYNRWLIGNFRKYLKGKILEVGAGLGGLAKHLPQNSLYLSDLNPEYFEHLKEEIGAQTILLDIENEAPKKYQNFFDAILSSNVFEHIENDQNAFDNCYKLLKDNGHLCLFIPARAEIFGSLDRDMGHFRRYSLEEVKSKAKKSGYKIIEARYANLPGYFTWWGRGVLLGKLINKSGKSQTDNLLARIFDIFITPLLLLEKFYSPPFGQSVILVAQKPNS
ncbi:MAG: putative methyltransferase [Candidatus Shapirobacteria bacterium GW2011_GWE1_38_10]|uniref:Putative methyltransferase n=1 Tax=Candidatus Shapirobacteria bacterium GW2011_GWE1_38_10 TaxID=1618488 RepID=A0A0G0HYZ6_9BACT|nr:MAG: putative methyltransferase [Candidatus Shapirobacteria bacterium GW2011_GWE1_38_10]